jgi:glucose/arabinose dehydrogenase
MTRLLLLTAVRLASAAFAVSAVPPPPASAQTPLPKPLAEGLKNPESVAVGPNGRLYVSVIGEFDTDGDGSVVVIENGKVTTLAAGLDDPKGLAVTPQFIYVADKKKVWRIGKGKADVFAPTNSFPVEPMFLNDLVVDPESGTLYVSDSGDKKGAGGAVFRITPQGQVSVVVDAKKLPGLHTPNGVAMDGAAHILLADFGTGKLYRVKVADGSSEMIAEGLGAADGLAWDHFGRLYVSDYKGGRVFGIARPGDKPVLVAQGFKQAADICYDHANKRILVPDMAAGTLTAISPAIPGHEVDETPLAVQTEVAFPDLKWTGWKSETDTGKVAELRPIVLTHAGDGSNRVFVATQHGVVHSFANDPKAAETKVFLDIQDRVQYDDRTNEEGFLGLAFHPKFKETGELFVFYTPRKSKNTNVVSRFRVSKDDPNKADPASEEEVFRFAKPFWNHDGGTICFGPDGMLYITHGDGGAANDPFDNGQKMSSPLGKILRIDVNSKDAGKNYAVPKDNPFVGTKDALPEIWALGLRNVWRMSFDRKTGQLWAADVGQNLYEEVNIITKGGNYGWNRRESFHPFGARGVGANKDMIDPVWEYHHDVGKSVTGGHVYRGKKLPELDGHYLYGDYVTTKIWALKVDDKTGRAVANRGIKDRAKPILSFGEDEQGEVYLLTTARDGKGVYAFTK